MIGCSSFYVLDEPDQKKTLLRVFQGTGSKFFGSQFFADPDSEKKV